MGGGVTIGCDPSLGSRSRRFRQAGELAVVLSGKLIWGAAMVLCPADMLLFALARNDMVVSPGWGRLVLAFALQLVVLALVAGWSVIRARGSSHDDSDASYRRHVPVTFLTLVVITTALSLDLLYTALVCPGVGMQTARGQPLC